MRHTTLTEIAFNKIEQYYNREFKKSINKDKSSILRINEFVVVTCNFDKIYPFQVCYSTKREIKVHEFKGVIDVLEFLRNQIYF